MEKMVLHQRFSRVKGSLSSFFKERGQLIDALFVSALTGEHVFVLGTPGTGKSALLHSITGCLGFKREEVFSTLLTQYSTPEEVCGPPDFKKLKSQGVYERRTQGYMPSARAAFLDECFKANSSILNSLLMLLNERKFFNGGVLVDCPIEMVLGASNEMPQDKSLDALFDRFLLRVVVEPLRNPNNQQAVIFGAEEYTMTTNLASETLAAARKAVQQVTFPKEAQDFCIMLKSAVEAEGFYASDRRWKTAMKAVQATAFLAGRKEVQTDDFQVLAMILWQKPKDRPALYKIIMSQTNPLALKAQEINDMMVEILTNHRKDMEVATGGSAKLALITDVAGKLDDLLDECESILAPLKKSEALDLRNVHQDLVKTRKEFGAAMLGGQTRRKRK